jgi:hypothetical protein
MRKNVVFESCMFVYVDGRCGHYYYYYFIIIISGVRLSLLVLRPLLAYCSSTQNKHK